MGPQGRFDFSDWGGEKQTGGREPSLEYPLSFPRLASVLLSQILFSCV